jgi:hypothetical protein
LFEMILPSWSDLKKPATHGCPKSLSLYHLLSLLPVLPLVNMTLVSQETLVMCIINEMSCTLRLSSKAWLASGISASARHRYLLMSEMQWTVTRLFPAALVFPCCIWSSVQRSWAKLCGLWPSCGEKLKLDIQIVYLYYTYIYHLSVCVMYTCYWLTLIGIDIDCYWPCSLDSCRNSLFHIIPSFNLN